MTAIPSGTRGAVHRRKSRTCTRLESPKRSANWGKRGMIDQNGGLGGGGVPNYGGKSTWVRDDHRDGIIERSISSFDANARPIRAVWASGGVLRPFDVWLSNRWQVAGTLLYPTMLSRAYARSAVCARYEPRCRSKVRSFLKGDVCSLCDEQGTVSHVACQNFSSKRPISDWRGTPKWRFEGRHRLQEPKMGRLSVWKTFPDPEDSHANRRTEEGEAGSSRFN